MISGLRFGVALAFFGRKDFQKWASAGTVVLLSARTHEIEARIKSTG
jgi:hypothetical protein